MSGKRIFMSFMFFGCFIALGIGIYGLSSSLMAAIALPVSAAFWVIWSKIDLK